MTTSAMEFILIVLSGIALSIGVLAFCEPTPPEERGSIYQATYYDCEPEKLSSFVLACIKDANPQSDEEPEDWIRQCERTGKEIVCQKQPGFLIMLNHNRSPVFSCQEAQAPREKEVCFGR